MVGFFKKIFNEIENQPFYVLIIAGLFLLLYVLVFTPSIPISDQWALVPLLESTSFSSLFAQHNEHRIIFPKLIYLSLAHLSRWDLRFETVASLLFFSLLIFLIYKSFGERVNNKTARWIILAALLAEFSPIHHENILWGWQLQIMLCVLMVFVAIRAIGRAGSQIRLLLASIFSLFIASFSFMNGLIGWIVCSLSVFRKKDWKPLNLSVFIFSMAFTFILYFVGYAFGSRAFDSFGSLSKLFQIPAYFFVYMGANFIPTYKLGPALPIVLLLSGVCGAILLLLGTLLIVKTWNFEREQTLIPYMMMLFGLFSALATSVGRINYGLKLALLSRYHVFQMFYLIGFVWILVLYLIELDLLKKYCRIFIFVFVFIFLLNWIGGIGLGILKINKFFPVEQEIKMKGENASSEKLKLIYPDLSVLRERISSLKEMKYNIFSE